MSGTGGRARWRGRRANLVVLGTAGTLASAGLAGCGDSATFHRNVYKSEADCALDYNPATCAAQGTRALDGQFLGPVFRMRNGRADACRGDDPGPGRIGLGIAGLGHRVGQVSVERGGFGTSCPSRSRSRSRSAWGFGS